LSNNMTTATRLFFAFGTIVVLCVISAILSITRLNSIQSNLETVVTVNNERMDINYDMKLSVMTVARIIRSIALLKDDKAEQERQVEKLQTVSEAYDKRWDDLNRFPPSEKAKQLRADIASTVAQARDANNKFLELVNAGKTDEAAEFLMQQANPKLDAVLAALDHNIQYTLDNNKAQYEQSKADYQQARLILIIMNLIMVATAVIMGWLITRNLVRTLGAEPFEAKQLAERVAQGDLTGVVRLRTGDTTSLMYALDQMKSQLTSIVGQIKEAGESISTASGQIAAGNTDLSARTEQQAASLEETAASMEELTSTVRQNAESAAQGNTLAANASEIAARGGEVVGRVVHTMREISDSSAKVAEIISTIESIAFQTNILALNAAVEAARAGEQGRGFAVVASEVRSLAQRAGTAAKEIKDLINESVDRVTTGTEQVDEAGRTINEVVSAVRRVTDLTAEIAAASNEQHKGIEQVNSAVSQMDEVTQQNAALVEQASAAAQAMAEQAHGLRTAVSVFKVSTSHSAFASITSAAPRKPAMPARKSPVRPAPREVRTPAAATVVVAPNAQSEDAWETF
jgi:methyl-accepting chemotaxis protein